MKINDELVEAVRKVAAEQDRDERDVIEEAIRRYLDAPAASPTESLRQEQSHRKTRRFVALLDRMGSRFDLDEDEAMNLANAELHAMREERRAGREGEQR
jgi:glutamyl-tRNA reductase